jgi:glutamine amidotransferase
MIAIIDYGRGNLGSVEKAFGRVRVPAVVTQDPRAVDEAAAVVLPGDGAFHDAMENLARLGLLPALGRALDGRRPFLGICLGYQLLFSSSEEFGEGHGLDVIPGAVRRFAPGRKIPHMGWNRVRHGGALRLFAGVPDGAHFYFVHSYYPVVAGSAGSGMGEGGLFEERGAPGVGSEVAGQERGAPGVGSEVAGRERGAPGVGSGAGQERGAPDAGASGECGAPGVRSGVAVNGLRVAWCEYGVTFAAAIERGLIFATQFHPEKSQRWGLRLLENFAALVTDGG